MSPIIHQTLTYYHHPVSQGSRSVHAALLIGKVQFVPVVIDIMTGQQSTPEYTAINPAQKVPAIRDGDFVLFESTSIFRYLAGTRPSVKSLYPQDAKGRAQVDCYLYWHHTNTRIIINFLQDFFFKVEFQKIAPPANRAERLHEVEEKLAYIEKNFLGGEKKFKYIANQPSLTYADLSAHAEILSLLFINYDFSKFPHLQQWMEMISNLPEVKEASAGHNDLVKKHVPQLNEFIKRII